MTRLQPENGSMAVGAAIVQNPCTGSSAQAWGFISLGGTSYNFANQLSGCA